MENDFLDDDWLKEELSDEYIHDDDFSFSVVKKIQLNESTQKRYFYIILTAMVAITSLLFIPGLMMIYGETPTSLSLIGSTPQQQSSFRQVELIGLGVILLSFILIWSFEDFDLI